MTHIIKRSGWFKGKGKTRFLLVLLILPVLPEKSEQFQKRYYKGGQTVPTTILKDKVMNHHPNSVYSVKRYSGPAQMVNSGGMIKIRQVPSLPPHIVQVSRTTPPIRHVKFKISPVRFSNYPIYPPPPIKKDLTCKGRKNLLDDIGILSLITAMTSSSFGLYTIIVNSMTSNNIGLASTFLSILIWLPSTLITLYNKSGDLVNFISNFLNGLSFINAMYGLIGVVYGTADVLASVAGETIGIISLVLSIVATFPEYLDELIEYLYRSAGFKGRKRLMYYIENYGCSEHFPRVFKLLGQPTYDVVNTFLKNKIMMKGNNGNYL